MSSFWMSIILSGLSAFVPAVAHAGFASSCASIFASEYTLEGRIEVTPKGQSGPKAADYALTLKKADALLGDLLIPKETTVEVGNLFIFSNFDPKEFTIYIGVRPDSMGKKHPNINQNSLVHEYGHAILEKNLINKVPDYQKQMTAIRDSASNGTSPAELIQIALHEFFADAVAVLTTKNPNAVSEVLYDSSRPLKKFSYNDFSLRRQTDGKNPQALQQWRELLKTEEIRQDPGFILLPSRWRFWQLIKTRIDGERYQKQVLTKIFPHLEKEIKALLLNPTLKTATPQEIESLNQRLIQHLNEVL